MIARSRKRRGALPKYPDTEHWVAVKHFELADGKKVQPGDVVDVSEWMRPDSWERAGWIRKVPAKAEAVAS
jgi:hypothetical protein